LRIGRLILGLMLALAGLGPAAPVAWSQTPAASQSAGGCTDPAIARRRTAFQSAYDAKDYARALTLIDEVWNACLAERGPSTLKAEVQSDYALTLHHSGDDGGCLEMLQDYSPELTVRPSPAMQALPKPVQAALRTNFGLCRAFCDEAENYTDARCAWLRADAQFDLFVGGDFKPRPCPFAAPEGAIGLPGKGPARCLALTPAPTPFDFSAADEHDASEICPGLALLTRGGGAKALKVPDKSLLRSKRFCCAEPKLAVDGRGRIEIQPADNPPEDCLFGHRELVMQDVLTLTKGRLVLVHRLHDLD
jgi:hypothetical protein